MGFSMKKNIWFLIFALGALGCMPQPTQASIAEAANSFGIGALAGVVSVSLFKLASCYKFDSIIIDDGTFIHFGTAALITGILFPYLANISAQKLTHTRHHKAPNGILATLAFAIGSYTAGTYLFPQNEGAGVLFSLMPGLTFFGTGVYQLCTRNSYSAGWHI